jgi:hypothetical protein
MVHDDLNLKGAWFSTRSMKLACALHAAGFPFKENAECTRLNQNGKESFTWHFEPVNGAGEKLEIFLKAWEDPEGANVARPSNLVCFLVSREVLFNRTHIISESHKIPEHLLLNRGDARLAVTNKLNRDERNQLAQLAS